MAVLRPTVMSGGLRCLLTSTPGSPIPPSNPMRSRHSACDVSLPLRVGLTNIRACLIYG